MSDGEAAVKARIVQYQRDIIRLSNKPKVTLADRNKLTKMVLIKSGLEEALSIISSYGEATRGRQR